MRISDWSSDVCSSDLDEELFGRAFDPWVIRRFLTYLAPYRRRIALGVAAVLTFTITQLSIPLIVRAVIDDALAEGAGDLVLLQIFVGLFVAVVALNYAANHLMEATVSRSEEHTSELQSLMRISYAVFCLKQKNHNKREK